MESLTRYFIANPKVTIIITIFISTLGLLGLKQMNAETFPNVNFAIALIDTNYPGATAEDIETKITRPIEDEIRKISGLKDVRSISQFGRSRINIRVDMDNKSVIIKDVMGEIQRAIDRVQDLPKDLLQKPKFTEMKSEEFAAIEIAVLGQNDERQRDIISERLKEELEDNSLVKNVQLDGFLKREFQINLSLKNAIKYHISIDEIIGQIKNHNVDIPAGEIEVDSIQSIVRLNSKIKNKTDIERIPIRSVLGGEKIFLSDVAEVLDASEKPKILTRYKSKPSTNLTVLKKGGADTIKLVDTIYPILESYKKNYPENEFIIFNNEANRVKDKISILSTNAYYGFAIVIIVLLFFLPGRVGFITSLSLPITLLTTLGIMSALSLTLNSITILALIISMGMLVDNAIVISDEWLKKKEKGLNSYEAAVSSVIELWIPITATALTTIAAFLPMLVTKGVMGEFIYAIPIVVTVSLVICLLESFFLLPMRLHISSLYFRSKKNSKIYESTQSTNTWLTPILEKFTLLITWTVKNKYLTSLGISGLFFFSIIVAVFFNKFYLFPSDQTEIYLGRLKLDPSTALSKTSLTMQDLEQQILEKIPQNWIKHSVSIAGSSLADPIDIRGEMGDNVGIVKIFASDYAKIHIPYTQFLEALNLIKIPDAKELMFEELVEGPPVGAAISAVFRSNNSTMLNHVIQDVIDNIKDIPGISNVKVDDVYGPKEISVVIDKEKIARLGLTSQQVGDTIRAAIGGVIISDVSLNNKTVDLKVSFDANSKIDIKKLDQILIKDNFGNLLSLSQVATLVEIANNPQIKRFDFKIARTILGDVDNIKITSNEANKKIQKIFNDLKKQYPDVSLVFSGEQENTNESMVSLLSALFLSLIAIYAIMVGIFGSFLSPALIMTSIPLGLFGVSISFWLHGRPLGFLAMNGVIALGGIIVNNGIILIDYINRMRKENNFTLNEILVKAPVDRLRPVLATSLTTMGGLFPTAYGIGGADNMLVPMTLALAWGLLSGTFLTLIWIPSGYAIIEDIITFFKRNK